MADVEDVGHYMQATGRMRERAEAAEARAAELEAENQQLREFAFGPAPEWEVANTGLKHRVRELEFAETRIGDLEVALNDMELHDDTGDPFDQGYMRAVREMQA